MSTEHLSSFHTVDSEWLASYSAGGLSPVKRLLIECQNAIQPALGERLDRLDEVGGVFLETAKGEGLSLDFAERLSKALDHASAHQGEAQDALNTNNERAANGHDDEWMPAPLRQFLEQSDIKLNWRKGGPGVEKAALIDQDGERLYLLKARPGLKMPMHSHTGEEWTLVLQGGYHAGDAGYIRGDLHREDEDCTHQPIIDDHGRNCISLVADEGKLRFRDPIMKILQPLIGI